MRVRKALDNEYSGQEDHSDGSHLRALGRCLDPGSPRLISRKRDRSSETRLDLKGELHRAGAFSILESRRPMGLIIPRDG